MGVLWREGYNDTSIADLRAIESHLRVNSGIADRGPLKTCFACASALERGRVDTQVAGVVEATMADV